MNRLAIAIVVAIMLYGSTAINGASAADCSPLVVVDRGLTIVPFAVPVATPVTIVNSGSVLYAASPSLPSAGGSLPAATSGSQAQAFTDEELAQFRAWRAAKTTGAAAIRSSAASTRTESSLVATNCATCHGGAAPKAGLSLGDSLTPQVRLRAIAAVVHGDMPPGRPLPAAELTALLRELATDAPATSASQSSHQK